MADFSDPLHAKSLALRAAIQAVVRRNALHHDSPNLMAREAHLAAHAVGLPYDHLQHGRKKRATELRFFSFHLCASSVQVCSCLMFCEAKRR